MIFLFCFWITLCYIWITRKGLILSIIFPKLQSFRVWAWSLFQVLQTEFKQIFVFADLRHTTGTSTSTYIWKREEITSVFIFEYKCYKHFLKWINIFEIKRRHPTNINLLEWVISWSYTAGEVNLSTEIKVNWFVQY